MIYEVIEWQGSLKVFFELPFHQICENILCEERRQRYWHCEQKNMGESEPSLSMNRESVHAFLWIKDERGQRPNYKWPKGSPNNERENVKNSNESLSWFRLQGRHDCEKCVPRVRVVPIKTSTKSLQTQIPCALMKSLAGHSLQGVSHSLPTALGAGAKAETEKISCK